jgi:1-acyl-sn-glycerol-3-phosphate acyltransferase
MVDSFYDGKCVLITGCTGFVGKVILEKLLFALPQIQKIYTFIRTKKGSSVQERFQKEIIESPCFDRLRSSGIDFDAWVRDKVKPIGGDLLKRNLGLSDMDHAELIENVNVVLNSAASVDFNQRLDQALQINTMGTLRVLKLVRACKRVAAFVQISTAYVNADKEGWVEEKIYSFAREPRALLAELLSIPLDEIERRTPSVLGRYPNTYTFTKNLTEQILQSEIGPIPFCIVRPTIIGGAWKEPFPGWVDSVSAAGAFYLSGGLGLLKIAIGNQNNIGDQIPVDLVSNAVIVCAALYCKPFAPNVVHVGSSARNPVRWRTCREVITAYWKKFPAEKAFGKVTFLMTNSRAFFNAYRFVHRTLPAMALTALSKVVATPTNVKNVQRYQKLVNREMLISTSFSHFTCFEWIFASQNIVNLMKMLNSDELLKFELDVSPMDWRIYLANYAFGLKKFVLKEKISNPVDGSSLDINWDYRNPNYFSDITWAYNSGSSINVRGLREMRSIILNTSRVQEAITKLSENEKNPQQAFKELTHKASEIASNMICDLQMPMVRMLGWGLRKVWRTIYDKIVVDINAINKLKKMINSKEGSIVIVPTHRSYVDFLIVSYVLFSYNVKVPYIAAGEDFLKIFLVNHLLRMTGAFFIRRRIASDVLYQAILTAYVQQLVKDNQFLEFFIEGTRSRSGKILRPKFGLLSMCTDTYFESSLSDISFVPLTINYERVLEGETFPLELLGEQKVRESLSRIIKAAKILSMNFGKIYIGIVDPISIKGMTQGIMPKNADEKLAINTKLGYEIVYRLQENSVIIPTALVAAILLMHRRGVSEDELISKVEWLRDEIKFRGYKLGGLDSGNAQSAVRNAIGHLKQTLTHKKDMFEPSVSLHTDYKNILLLSYYRNSIHHIFAIEAVVACAMFSFGEKLAWGEGIPRQRALEEMMFLSNLLESEFVLREDITNLEVINKTIEFIKKRGILAEENGKLKIRRSGELAISMMCSLIWPLIDTYWATLTFCSALRKKQALKPEKLIQSIQWFSENMYEERNMSYYESCSQENIKNALSAYEKIQVLERVGSDRAYQLAEKYAQDETKVQELLEHLSNFRKTSIVKIVSAHDELRRALLSEFPEMPKL